MSKITEVLLATRNRHKLEEIKAILGDAAGIAVLSLRDFPHLAVKETGRSLLQNSLVKAEFAYKFTGKPSLADDSGLFVDGLGGEPGVFSSRYAATDRERINKVLRRLREGIKRSAMFKAVFVYYFAEGKYRSFEGTCSGTIALEPRGTNGFGYDPIFIPRGYKKTFAEMAPGFKNRISHRGRALRKFIKYFSAR